MAKLSIIVELDADTVRRLAVLGKPSEVLEQLAHAAALRPDHPRREKTDESLQGERTKADAAIAERRTSVEGAGAVLAHEGRQRAADESLAVERKATNRDLAGERAHADTLIVDQREANEQMVSATIRAQELRGEAEAAKARAEEGEARAEASERELRAVAEFREMFIGILGHDLRNPLGAILMAAGLLLGHGRLNEEDAKMAARIVRGSQRMSRMISQVLDLTRARLGGGLLIETEPTDLREICENIVGEFEASIQLEVEGDLTGTWDQDRLAEVLSNLTGNAIGYATPGTAVIVKARPDGTAVVVEVSNQGLPIPADVLPFIFEPFRRANQREKSTTGNLGLGLYIAHQIVLSHGGTLDVDCADGTTTFVMRIPRG